jgi:hypothetical protein
MLQHVAVLVATKDIQLNEKHRFCVFLRRATIEKFIITYHMTYILMPEATKRLFQKQKLKKNKV